MVGKQWVLSSLPKLQQIRSSEIDGASAERFELSRVPATRFTSFGNVDFVGHGFTRPGLFMAGDTNAHIRSWCVSVGAAEYRGH